jgi:hypothetical protein
MKLGIILLGVALFTVPSVHGVATNAVTGPKYLVFMLEHDRNMSINRPGSFNKRQFDSVKSHFPGYAEPTRIKVGIGFVFPYFEYPINDVESCLRKFLALSLETDTPVVVKLDGENWLNGRPDLWNWWDPAKPGYNPDNRQNVEWTSWNPEDAIKISWRDWGRQLRVTPMINLLSPRYRAECHKAMDRLVPIIVEWQRQLPPDKKDLFVGLNLGWESAVGNSSYYRTNGNALLNRPESEDPAKPAFSWDDVLCRGMVQLGFAALKSGGIRNSGGITEGDLTEVARRHLEDLCRYAKTLGLPREKIFSHGVGNGKGELLYDSAVNAFSCPGWSEYFNSLNIQADEGIMRNIRRSDAPYWAAVEWLLLYPTSQYGTWKSSIENTIKASGCKFMCIFNWELLLDKKGEPTEAVKAARDVVLESKKALK